MSPRRIAPPPEPPESAEIPERATGHHSEWCPEPDYCPAAVVISDRDPRWILQTTPEEEEAWGRAYTRVHYTHLTSVASPDERPSLEQSVRVELLPEAAPRGRPRVAPGGISRASRANRRCDRCGTLHHEARCPQCWPAWHGSTRTAALPHDWHKLRAAVIARDPMCQLQFDGCQGASVQADHIGDRLDHRLEMLRGVCKSCHGKRTAAQGHAAQARPQRKAWQ